MWLYLAMLTFTRLNVDLSLVPSWLTVTQSQCYELIRYLGRYRRSSSLSSCLASLEGVNGCSSSLSVFTHIVSSPFWGIHWFISSFTSLPQDWSYQFVIIKSHTIATKLSITRAMDDTESSGEKNLVVRTPPNDMNLEASLQKDCPILSDFPPVVRQRIWTMCLGGSTIVLTFSPENVHDMIANDQRLKSLYSFGVEGLPKKGRPGRKLLAILLTCKQVYEGYPFP